MASTTEVTIVREFYEALQRGEFEGWDGIIDQNVLINSPIGRTPRYRAGHCWGRARTPRVNRGRIGVGPPTATGQVGSPADD